MIFNFRIKERPHGQCGTATWFFKGHDPIEVVEKFKKENPKNFKYATIVYLNIGKGCWDVKSILENRSKVLADFYGNLKYKVLKNNEVIVACASIVDAAQYFEDYDADEIQRIRSSQDL